MPEQIRKKRVFICEFLQESNSFNSVLTQLDAFESSGIYEGDAVLHSNGCAGETVKGMLQGVADADLEAVGGICMRSKSGGPVNHTLVDDFLSRILKILKQSSPLDGVLVSLHGATVSDVSDDVSGDIVSAIRSCVGQDTALAASCDLHANITTQMIKNADFICGYQTYPHLDHYQVGYRAAGLLAQKVGGRKLATYRVTIPMMAPAHGYSTKKGGLHSLMEKGHALVRAGEIEDFSVFQVQPWLDVPEIASSVLVTAASDEAAEVAAKELAAQEFALRKELNGEPLWSITNVIQAALENQGDKPVVLVDSADSPNAGACGDSAEVLPYVLPYRDSLRTALSLNDEGAVNEAFALGVGGCGDFVLGGSLAPLLSKPILVENAVVKSLHTGNFILGGPAERAQKRNLGRCAVIEAGEIQILLTVRGQNEGDLQFYRGFGIEPTLCRLVCVKACTSFRAGYEPLAALICNTATRGAAGTVLTELPFTHLPNPLYPFQSISESDVSTPVRYR